MCDTAEGGGALVWENMGFGGYGRSPDFLGPKENTRNHLKPRKKALPISSYLGPSLP